MTEITAQPPEAAPGGTLAIVAKPPGEGFAEKLSQAQETATANPKVPTGLEVKTGKAAILQSNTESQSPDPQLNQATQTAPLIPVDASPSVSASLAQNPAVTLSTAAATLTLQPKSSTTQALLQTEPLVETNVVAAATVANPVAEAQGVKPGKPVKTGTLTQTVPATPAVTQPTVVLPVAVPSPAAPVLTTSASTPATPQPAAALTRVSQAPTDKSEQTVTPDAEQPVDVSATPAPSGQTKSVPTSPSTPLVSPTPGPLTKGPDRVSLETLKQDYGDIVDVHSFKSDAPAPAPTTTEPAPAPAPQSATVQTPTEIPQTVTPLAATTPSEVPTPTPSGTAKPGSAPRVLEVQGATTQTTTPQAVQPGQLMADDDAQPDDSPGNSAPGTKPAPTGSAAFVLAGPQSNSTAGASSTTATQQAQDVTAPPVDRAHVINQVADRIQLLAIAKQQDGVVVHLEPPNLGSITLVVKAVAQTVTAQVTASDEHVRTALESGRDQLGQQLQTRGYHLASISVGSTSASADTGSGLSQNSKNGANVADLWQGRQQTGRQQAGSAPTRNASTVKTEAAAPRVSSTSATGLDLWI